MSKIVAAEMLEPGEIVLKDFPVPQIEDDAILMKVVAVGICGSDKHMFAGKMNVSWPLIPGHELSGIVEKIGKNANNTMKIVGGIIKEGDSITVTPGSQSCSKCWYCVHVPHRPQLCPNRTVFGFRSSKDSPHLFGAFSEYMYIPGNSFVLKIPEGLSLERATLCEPLSVAQRAVSRGLSPGIPNAGEGIGIGVRCAVMGVGPIGLLVVATLRSMGVGEIIAVDASKERLDFSKKFGATQLIDISELGMEDRKDKILSFTDNVGPDVVIECAGVPSAFSEGLDLVRRGGKLIEVGHYGDPGSVDIRPHQVCNKDVDILGSWAYPQVQFEPAIEMLLRTDLPIDDIFTHKMSLENIQQGIEITGTSECLKVILSP